MTDQDKRSQARHHAYTAVLLLTLAAVIFTYLIELSRGKADPFNAVVLPLLAGLLGFLAVGHLRHISDLRWTERGFFVVSAFTFFGKLGFTLLGSYTPLERTHELSQVYIWTPFIYAFAFLVGTPRAGLYRAGGVYFIGLGIGLTAVLQGVPLSGYRLSEYYLGNLVLLALLYLVGSLRTRIEELQTDLSETTRLATLDFLTGVSNRRLETRLQHELELYRRYGTPVAVILFDIDHFKTFNDTHGHVAGDEVLKTVAEAVQHELRPTDAFGRWGGEEFLVVAAHTDARQATLLAERLRRLVEAAEVGRARVTASFGVAMYHNDTRLGALIERADTALYDAKARGRNRVELGNLGGLPQGVALPQLSYPFPEVLKQPDREVVAEVTDWLVEFKLGPAPSYLRKHMALNFTTLAVTLHPYAPYTWQLVLGKWYCWAFLHDDRCDASELGRQPGRVKVLTDRLADLFAGATVHAEDEPLGHALAELRGELLELGGTAWFTELRTELDHYFVALQWEAHNRAAAMTPSVARYLEMRPVTVGLQLDDLFSCADGVSLERVGRHPLLLEPTRLTNELVCWSNDLVSLDKELQQGDVHNLVQVLQDEHGLSLQRAVERTKQQHDETLDDYLDAERRVREQFGDWSELGTYLELLRARIRGIHDWAVVSGRYR